MFDTPHPVSPPSRSRSLRFGWLLPLLLLPFLLALTSSAVAQNRDRFYNGVRNGEHGGHYDRGHDRRYDDGRHQGGIGPGKGALIGGGAGAVLGALFGGGLKGSLIAGAAGAGIGAIAGQAHQNSERRDDYRHHR